jgi:hypothetical protein
MKGMELCRRYYWEVGRPAIQRACPEALPYLAAGLVGEGSECLGFDDELSQDHDWGPGFCLWLADDALTQYGEQLRSIYDSLPGEFLGFSRPQAAPESADRVGVLSVEGFYRRFLNTLPKTLADWLTVSDQALSVCVNGEVFEDSPGKFTAVRQQLLTYYPEVVRRKRLAARCALAAQAGQYNLPRCLERGERVAALQALGEFIDHAQAAVFYLERRYRPYYKWAHRALLDLPLGQRTGPLFQDLTEFSIEYVQPTVETLCGLLIRELADQGLSQSSGTFLLDHAKEVQGTIQRPSIRELPLLAFS